MIWLEVFHHSKHVIVFLINSRINLKVSLHYISERRLFSQWLPLNEITTNRMNYNIFIIFTIILAFTGSLILKSKLWSKIFKLSHIHKDVFLKKQYLTVSTFQFHAFSIFFLDCVLWRKIQLDSQSSCCFSLCSWTFQASSGQHVLYNSSFNICDSSCLNWKWYLVFVT